MIGAHCVLTAAVFLLTGCSLHLHTGESVAADSETRSVVGTYRGREGRWAGCPSTTLP